MDLGELTMRCEDRKMQSRCRPGSLRGLRWSARPSLGRLGVCVARAGLFVPRSSLAALLFVGLLYYSRHDRDMHKPHLLLYITPSFFL